jgi:hypothetical protein
MDVIMRIKKTAIRKSCTNKCRNIAPGPGMIDPILQTPKAKLLLFIEDHVVVRRRDVPKTEQKKRKKKNYNGSKKKAFIIDEFEEGSCTHKIFSLKRLIPARYSDRYEYNIYFRINSHYFLHLSFLQDL